MNDLFELVNGAWVNAHEIPADRGIDGAFYVLRDKSEEDVHAILEDGTGLGGTLFKSFMDNPGDISSLDPDLAKIEVANVDEFVRGLGELERVGIGGPVSYWVEKDSQGEESVAYIFQSGLGLPDEAYYRDEDHAETLAAYKAHVEKMLGFLEPKYLQGLTPQIAAERIVNLESQLAASHWDVVKARDAVATYNPTDLEEMPPLVRTLLGASGLSGKVVNMMPSFTSDLDGMLRRETLADWQLWAAWNILRSRAGVLSEEIGEANFEFYGKKLSGATEQRDRWKRGVGLAESLVGEDIGRSYVDKHFPPSSKEKMLELVEYLIAAYRSRIQQLEWMSEPTKQRALEKLAQFNAKIGYPEKWRSYDGLEFSEDLVDNVRRGAAFEHDYQLSKIGKASDRQEWVSSPQTVNAFYNPVVNDITFPAAILQPPFFDPDADAAENFGAIGAVIGHEIGHGFDDQGSRYDGLGNLNSWWTDEDRANFEQLTAKLVGQFNGLVPSVLEGTKTKGVNGEFTLGENIGDLGGLGIAVVAYKKYLDDNSLEDVQPQKFGDLEGEYTGFQRLFLAWARVWRSKARPEMAAQLLAIDPHAPNEFRCNVIAANIAEFYEAFEVEQGSTMWIDPEDRVTIW
ncbi:Neutral endopeptidase [Corynebacterium afermentans subsp. afermentans]|uniref:Endothelin-converting enzyme Metallo peptidase. MEROPS family M13 n=1 Tax=Corynebacterium afermentans TaxID=38286 RepID=A0A9X8WI59_9CORY|nr:M13-type metalloendopeptidase [Corynebacterium afermentans]OAA16125.1 peptidase M13 [Corynebacterium afermentans subsp. afermentans]WJY55736.1 Neutral endopeptidase [Corynebacterium afermentans subsp. afermentans]SIQ32226.1 endothelin-converting enzyme Metallo peptidase. MEROPS family M13 [Corynebacterium afermentans]